MDDQPAEFNFPEQPTLKGPAPHGYVLTERSRVIARPGLSRDGDEVLFAALGEAVLRWGIQSGSRFEFVSVPPRADPGVVSRFRIPFGPLRPLVPCRVIAGIAEKDRVGFAHGALVGHPQQGWESFVVERDPDGVISMRIRVVAKPSAWWMRLAGPAARIALHLVLRRNLRALDGVVAGYAATTPRR